MTQLVVLLVSSYIPWTQADLEEWMDSPEDFMMELDTDNYDENVKVCLLRLVSGSLPDDG